MGFYRGITASYYGIAETIIHFVIYESIKAKLCELRGEDLYADERSPINFLEFMCAGAVSKTIATFFAYPHGTSHRFLLAWKLFQKLTLTHSVLLAPLVARKAFMVAHKAFMVAQKAFPLPISMSLVNELICLVCNKTKGKRGSVKQILYHCTV